MNISEKNLLSIFIGSILIDTIFLILNYNRIIFVSDRLTEWYTKLGVTAMAMDIIIIGIVVSLGILLSKTVLGSENNLGYTLLFVVLLQVIHDVIFALVFLYIPRDVSYVLDIFKDYAKEIKFNAIWSDSLMVIGCLLIAEGISYANDYTKQIVFLLSIYLGLYSLYTKRPDSLKSLINTVPGNTSNKIISQQKRNILK